MELTEIRRKIEQLKQLELVAEADESHNVIKRQIEHLKLSELIAEAELNKSEAKPGEISTRDPITLKPNPISAALYGAIYLGEISGWQDGAGRRPHHPDRYFRPFEEHRQGWHPGATGY